MVIYLYKLLGFNDDYNTAKVVRKYFKGQMQIMHFEQVNSGFYNDVKYDCNGNMMAMHRVRNHERKEVAMLQEVLDYLEEYVKQDCHWLCVGIDRYQRSNILEEVVDSELYGICREMTIRPMTEEDYDKIEKKLRAMAE